MVTQNSKTGVLDLDYQLIFIKTKNKNININANIKEIIVQELDKIKSKNSNVNDSTSSIHYFTTDSRENIELEIDLGILIIDENNKYYIKGKGGDYQCAKTKENKDILDKLNKMTAKEFGKFKIEYLKRKNNEPNKKKLSYFVGHIK